MHLCHQQPTSSVAPIALDAATAIAALLPVPTCPETQAPITSTEGTALCKSQSSVQLATNELLDQLNDNDAVIESSGSNKLQNYLGKSVIA